MTVLAQFGAVSIHFGTALEPAVRNLQKKTFGLPERSPTFRMRAFGPVACGCLRIAAAC
jgi:hypothetical protein